MDIAYKIFILHIFTLYTIKKPKQTFYIVVYMSVSLSIRSYFGNLFMGIRWVHRWLLYACVSTWSCYIPYGNKMVAVQRVLSSGFGCNFVGKTTENSCTDFVDTCFHCSMHALEGCKLLGIFDIRLFKMKQWALKLMFL